MRSQIKFSVILFVAVCLTITAYCQSNPIIYLIPGQGSDHRVFNNIDLGDSFEIKHLRQPTPKENTSMKEYALQLSKQIDTGTDFILIGVSLGGMLAVEISELLDPKLVIVISSAKSRNELPGRYRFQRNFPIYNLVSARMSKKGALILQPIVEPDRNKQKDTFVGMLNDKDPDFLKRTIAMIMEWEREEAPKNIIHIHGDNDKTLPHRHVKYDHIIKDGSHMMTLIRGAEISELILDILEIKGYH